jgi:glycerophosphoryl diester phosphodiesterase
MLIALPERALAAILKPGDAAQLPLRAFGVELANRRTVDRCHALGLRVDFWTVNDAATATRLLALGADGIMSDDPAAVVSALG